MTTTRNPTCLPEPGDLLRHRSGARVLVTKRGAYGVRGETTGPGRPEGSFVANLTVWARWMKDAEVLALGVPRGELGVAHLPTNPARPRWETDPTDDRCDLCACDRVAFHDLLLCAHPDCHFTVQVCEACGGDAEAHRILVEHLGACRVARRSEATYDPVSRSLEAPRRQLGLFGEAGR